MLPPTFKTFVQRLFADPALRDAFLAHPERVLSDHPASPEERRALLRLHTRLATADGVALGPLSPWP